MNKITMNENLFRLIFYIDTKISFDFSEFFILTSIILSMGYYSILIVKFLNCWMEEKYA